MWLRQLKAQSKTRGSFERIAHNAAQTKEQVNGVMNALQNVYKEQEALLRSTKEVLKSPCAIVRQRMK